MSETQVDNADLVTAISKLSAFAKVDPAVISMFANDATEVVASFGLPHEVLQTATRLYACHLLVVEASNGNQSESIGSMSHTKYDWSKQNDPYLLEFNQLLDRYGLNRQHGRVWTVD